MLLKFSSFWEFKEIEGVGSWELDLKLLLVGSQGQNGPARSQRQNASVQIGWAIHGPDALLFGLARSGLELNALLFQKRAEDAGETGRLFEVL
ncbi:hypothetical protein LH22_08535 [Pantoea rwandensis]|uniref:Uncharacterized protein n=1 Tax=Pantoea rwandensis TaxID=1076550 RepID=A0ABM5RHR9_9GAMM|nr:hypothetical protein LH22_08535 [Pantoea rwandensis]